MRKRPHFEIIGWKTPPGEDNKAVSPKPDTPQLSGPTVATPEKSASSPATNSQQKTAEQTLAAMSDVKPLTIGEIVDDEIPW
jgi:hypothetical protein